MSLILDALRKSERTRQQSLTGQLGSSELPSGPSRLPVPWLPILAAIVAANALLLYLLWPRNAPVRPLSRATPVSQVPATYHPAVRSLASEAVQPDETPVRPAPVPAPSNPTLVAPAQTAVPAGLGALQSVDELPPDVRQALPALHVDVLGYAPRPADRFVVINLKQYHIGDTLAEGPILKDIVPQGAVLDYRGTVFLLPAT